MNIKKYISHYKKYRTGYNVIIIILTIVYINNMANSHVKELSSKNVAAEKKEAKLISKIEKLEKQLDMCQNGADKLHAKMNLNFQNKNYHACKELYSKMGKLHPESDLFPEVKKIYDKIKKIEKDRVEKARLLVEKAKQEKLKALKKLKKKHDDISGITWYKQPYFNHYANTNLTSIYIGDNGSSRWLRLMMSYKGDDWIFFEKAYLSYDGNTEEIVFDKYDNKKTDNGAYSVWEWFDITVSSDIESFLRKFSKSKNAKMRFVGKYTKTHTLTWNERQGIRDVLNGYDALKQNIK